jgi:hypothetical protein
LGCCQVGRQDSSKVEATVLERAADGRPVGIVDDVTMVKRAAVVRLIALARSPASDTH